MYVHSIERTVNHLYKIYAIALAVHRPNTQLVESRSIQMDTDINDLKLNSNFLC